MQKAAGSNSEDGDKVTAVDDLFGRSKAVVAMAHLPALPGQPLHTSGSSVDTIVNYVGRDLEALRGTGIDGVLFCNENDRPYRLGPAAPETVAYMTAVIEQVRGALEVPFGVDVLWDPSAAVAVAAATGGSFVREVMSGGYVADFGLWQTRPADVLALRHRLGADHIKLFFNISAEFAAPIAPRGVGALARSTVMSCLADAICVSGPSTGSAVDLEQVRAAKKAVPDTAVFANTGARPETVRDTLDVADGIVVGSYLKRDGNTWNEVDRSRVERLLEAAAAGGTWTPRTPQTT